MESVKTTECGTEIWSVYQQRWLPVELATDADLAALPQGEVREAAIAARAGERARQASL